MWLHNHLLDKCFKSIKMTSSLNQNRQKVQNKETRKTSFLKEKVGDTELFKSVLNKRVTMHK